VEPFGNRPSVALREETIKLLKTVKVVEVVEKATDADRILLRDPGW
jgi:hypothetical protein